MNEAILGDTSFNNGHDLGPDKSGWHLSRETPWHKTIKPGYESLFEIFKSYFLTKGKIVDLNFLFQLFRRGCFLIFSVYSVCFVQLAFFLWLTTAIFVGLDSHSVCLKCTVRHQIYVHLFALEPFAASIQLFASQDLQLKLLEVPLEFLRLLKVLIYHKNALVLVVPAQTWLHANNFTILGSREERTIQWSIQHIH